MRQTGPQLEVEGAFDVTFGSGRSARLLVKDSHLELCVPGWRDARGFRTATRAGGRGSLAERLAPRMRERGLTAAVTVRGETIAVLDQKPPGLAARLVRTYPLRPRWRGLLRSVVLGWPGASLRTVR